MTKGAAETVAWFLFGGERDDHAIECWFGWSGFACLLVRCGRLDASRRVQA